MECANKEFKCEAHDPSIKCEACPEPTAAALRRIKELGDCEIATDEDMRELIKNYGKIYTH